MSFRDLFRRFGADPEERDPFANWPGPPSMRLVPPSHLSQLSRLPRGLDEDLDPQKYTPALIIALGTTGKQVLAQWLARVAQDRAGSQSNLRAILLTETPADTVYSDIVKVRQFDLVSNSPVGKRAGAGRNGSRRATARALYRHHPTFTPIWHYLLTCLKELGSAGGRSQGVRVLLVAGAADAEFGVIGDVLHMLRQASARYNNVNLLLSLDSPEPRLKKAEVYAALRELGRYTFSGRHETEPLPGQVLTSVEGSLLDFVFVIEKASPPFAGVDLDSPPFMQGLGQAMVETLFTLLHPSAAPVWEHLQNDLSQISEARRRSHLPLVHSLGIATLFMPLQEIKEFVAARLAQAVLFGEQQAPEGLLARNLRNSENYEAASRLTARKWLREGPCAHPLFNWLMDVDAPQGLRRLPDLSAEYESYRTTFFAQLGHGLTDLLNDADTTDHLQRAASTLHWLHEHLERLAAWAEEIHGTTASDAYDTLSFLLEEWQHGIGQLLNQVRDWEAALFVDSAGPTTQSEDSANEPAPTLTSDWQSDRRTATDSLQSDWREQSADPQVNADWRQASSRDVEPHPQSHRPAPQQPAALREILRNKLSAAERALNAATGGHVRLSLTSDGQDGVSEVETYYEGTIRPELSRHGLGNSASFSRIRERLSWWVDLPRNQPARLYLLCLPANDATSKEVSMPPPQARHTPADVDRLAETLFDLAHIQAQNIHSHLTGYWMSQRLEIPSFRAFVQRANKPFLAYDPEVAVRLSQDYSARPLRYLIAPDATMSEPYKRSAFPNVSPSEVNDVANDTEPTLLTALGLHRSIPLEAIMTLENAYDDYDHQQDLHIEAPEQLATAYENRLSQIRRERYPFPADLRMALTGDMRVSIFCQAVISGIIHQRDMGQLSTEKKWVAPTLVKEEEFIELATYTEDWSGLWRALRQFTLELPNDGDIARSPAHPFFRANRTQYMEQLRDAIRAERRSPGFQKKRQSFKEEYLDRWMAGGNQDLLQRAFLDLLQIELKRPVWSDL